MSYIDNGFNNLMYREPEGGGAVDFEVTEDIASKNIPSISGGVIAGGIFESSNGKLKIDFEMGTIEFSDGANTRIFIGDDGL